MDQLYLQSVIKDREREVEKHVAENQIYRHFRESIAERQDSGEKGANVLSLLWLSVINLLSGIFA